MSVALSLHAAEQAGMIAPELAQLLRTELVIQRAYEDRPTEGNARRYSEAIMAMSAYFAKHRA
jgi:hypothetical protein